MKTETLSDKILIIPATEIPYRNEFHAVSTRDVKEFIRKLKEFLLSKKSFTGKSIGYQYKPIIRKIDELAGEDLK